MLDNFQHGDNSKGVITYINWVMFVSASRVTDHILCDYDTVSRNAPHCWSFELRDTCTVQSTCSGTFSILVLLTNYYRSMKTNSSSDKVLPDDVSEPAPFHMRELDDDATILPKNTDIPTESPPPYEPTFVDIGSIRTDPHTSE